MTVRIINTSFFNYKKFSKFCITRYHKRDIVFLRNMKLHTKFHFTYTPGDENKKPI